MKTIDRSPVSRFENDEFEDLLHSFFRSEMPDPWPVVKAPASVMPMRPARQVQPLFRSRFALAASVLLLLFGSFFLSSLLRDKGQVTPNNGGNFTAKPLDFGKKGLPTTPKEMPNK